MSTRWLMSSLWLKERPHDACYDYYSPCCRGMDYCVSNHFIETQATTIDISPFLRLTRRIAWPSHESKGCDWWNYKFRDKMPSVPKVSIACFAPLICTNSAGLRLGTSTVPELVPSAFSHLSEPCGCQNTAPEGEESAPRLIFWKRTD